MRECLPHFYCLALAMVWSKSEKNRGHPLCTRFSRGIGSSESIGVVSKFSGSLRAGFLVPLACAAILIFLTLLLRRQTTA